MTGFRTAGAVLGICLGSLSCGMHETEVETAADLQPAFDWNLKSLLSKNPEARGIAFQLFERHWAEMQAYVAQLARSPEPARRMACAYLLARLGTKQDLGLLRGLLEDPTDRVRLTALRGIHRLRDGESVAALAALARSEIRYSERRTTLRVLRELDPVMAFEVCAGLAGDESWAKRRVAAQTLGSLGNQESVGLLRRLLNDDVWMVRVDAAGSVAKRRIATTRPELLTMARDELPAIRAAAASALGAMGVPDDLALVSGLALDDGAKTVRIAAAEALAGFPTSSALPQLARVLQKKGEHRKVRYAAIQGLRRIGGESAAELVRNTMSCDQVLRNMRDRESDRARPGK